MPTARKSCQGILNKTRPIKLKSGVNLKIANECCIKFDYNLSEISSYLVQLFLSRFNKSAGVAQLVEQLICNQSVMSSSLFTS